MLALTSLPVKAADKVDPKQLTIDVNSITFEEIDEPVATRDGGRPGAGVGIPSIPAPSDLPKPQTGPSIPMNQPGMTGGGAAGTISQVGAAIDVADKIVNLVDKIFTLIAKNQPVVNISVNYANAVPYGLSHWSQLQGWAAPRVKRYSFTCKNLYGMKVVDVVYQVHWTYGGNYQGKGKYLTGVTVEPVKVDTAWGYNVDLTAQVPDSTIANVGTADNPVASMQVQLAWKVHTIVKDIQEKSIFFVRGDGYMQPLTTSKMAPAKIKAEPSKKLDAIKNVQF